MKKGLILGAAALAAAAYAVPATSQAGEVKLGGYYRVQGVAGDLSITDNDQFTAQGGKGTQSSGYWRHRLNIEMDMIASEKSSAHMRFRPVDNDTVQGTSLGDTFAANSTDVSTSGTDGGSGWEIERLWLQTEAAGIGILAGEMPLSLNDNMLYNDDGASVGALVLSKTFGPVTVLAGDVFGIEGTTTNNNNDADLYAIAVLGKAGAIEYNATAAYLDAQETSVGPTVASSSVGDSGTVQTDTQNWWVAGTVKAGLGAVNLSVTGIYEDGYDNYENSSTKTATTQQMAEDGFMIAARLDGATGFGGWKAYGWWADEDFTPISDRPNWSNNYDGRGPVDLMAVAADYADNGATGVEAGVMHNSWGLGGGLTIKAGNFTIKPELDYWSINEDSMTVSGTAYKSPIDDAWGGSIDVSTEIDTGATLSLAFYYVDPSENLSRAAMPSALDIEAMHQTVLEVKVAF